MKDRRAIIEGELGRLMTIQLVEIDGYGQIKGQLAGIELDEVARDFLKEAPHKVAGRQVVLLESSTTHRHGFCFRLNEQRILCGIAISSMKLAQLRLSALCLYVALLGSIPILMRSVVVAECQKNTQPLYHLLMAISQRDWGMVKQVMVDQWDKMTKGRQQTIGVSLLAGLVFGRQLENGAPIQRYANKVARWWQQLQRDQLTIKQAQAALFNELNLLAEGDLSQHGDQLINQISEDVDSHLMTRLTVADIATRLGRSKDYLSRHFHQQTGWTLKRYILQRKVLLAKQLLEKQSIMDVAYDLHFSDQSHFAKVFRQITGESPKQYQHEHC